ncbi:cyclopropane-fatty-acyl-phospholipid synthase family protein [Aestuariibacter sp. A3R04]|uniref:SAM-dependent methyltransferase n=1 Tax=Aestuariibacter sp. A3R04 TaxID=2841571 RepID=UPI001C09642C|nr:cyclopropane-fatty-acyl-phospholipid synthase family protein [Aestuariibacter sp. A3R04]MBU3021906.1 cyclopropane-fatty-acyl-phospholipid synthase family protein [Aestuariibacter sp. A3R04]
MSHGETTFIFKHGGNAIDRACRSAFLNVLAMLPEGHMVIKENGAPVGELGTPGHPLRADINIVDIKAYRALLFGGSVAAGETYTNGLWTTSDLTSVIRIFARNLPMLDKWEEKFRWLLLPLHKLQHFLRRNTKSQAKKNIEAHYDLGNKLYTRFLDQTMMYSSAIYPDPNASLSDAQTHKLKTICDKLQLTEHDHLIEIGTGWGGLAVFAAKHYGCRVTTTTISEEQFAYAEAWIKRENLDDRVTLLKQDYRSLEGEYDKLVSIEMIEAVGKRYLGQFFTKCASLLKPDGLMLLQSITIDDRRFDTYSNSVDFIQKYIFPGGFLPSQLVINDYLKRFSDLSIRDLQDIGLDYAKTLDDWYKAFVNAREPLLQDGYDEHFIRMWTYYLKYCEGGFLERTISTVQLVLSKPHFNAPIGRG